MRYSVIVPVYNEEENIDRLIESLLKLEVSNFSYEILIVDNNSTDNTVKKIKKYPVKLLEEKRPGSYAARNKGINHASGEFLCFTDGDCIVDKDWLLNVNSFIINNNTFDLVAGNIIKTVVKKNIYSMYDDICFLNQEELVKYNKAVTANLIVHKRVFKNVGCFDGTKLTGEDVAFVFNATLKGYNLAYAEHAKVYHKSRDTFKAIEEKLYRFTKSKKYGSTIRMLFSLGLFPGIKQITRALKQKQIKTVTYVQLLFFSFIVGLKVTKRVLLK